MTCSTASLHALQARLHAWTLATPAFCPLRCRCHSQPCQARRSAATRPAAQRPLQMAHPPFPTAAWTAASHRPCPCRRQGRSQGHCRPCQRLDRCPRSPPPQPQTHPAEVQHTCDISAAIVAHCCLPCLVMTSPGSNPGSPVCLKAMCRGGRRPQSAEWRRSCNGSSGQ